MEGSKSSHAKARRREKNDHSNSRTNRSGLIYDLIEPLRPSVDRLLYQFMVKTTLHVSDFFETRQGICKVMPELTSKIIPLVRSLDPDINSIVKEFAGFFKTRLVQAHPEACPGDFQSGDDRISGNGTKKTKTELPPLPLSYEFEETQVQAMPESYEKTKIKSAQFDVQRGRCQNGQSGNPNGRPEGRKDKATLLAEELLDGKAEAIINKVIELAQNGDLNCSIA